MHDFSSFLGDLASANPVPGGGSVAALEVSMGASLVSMVCNLTLGRKRFADVQAEVEVILQESERIRVRAERLVTEDIDAYARVSGAMALPRESDSDKARRTATVQEALKDAAVPPLETMRLARQVVGLVEKLMGIGNPSAISDVGTAAQAALAGYHSAKLNVEINMASVRDAPWLAEMRENLQAAAPPDGAVSRVMTEVMRVIRGPRV